MQHVKAVPIDVSKLYLLLLMAPGWPIHGNLVFADPVSVRVTHSKVVHGIGDVRSLGHSAALGNEVTRGLASNQSNSAFSESPQRVSAEKSSYLTSMTTQSLTQHHFRC